MADIKVSQLESISARDVTDGDLLHCVSVSAAASQKMQMSVLSNSTIRNAVGPIDPTNASDYQAKGITTYDGNTVILPFLCADGVDRNHIYKISFDSAFTSSYGASTYKYSTGLVPANTSSGWSRNGNGAYKVITHGLGTTDINISIFAASDSAGNQLTLIPGYGGYGLGRYSSRHRARYGAAITNITDTTFLVQLALDGYRIPNVTGNIDTIHPWKYIKIVCRK